MNQFSKKNSVQTFGCRLNLLESELIEQSLDSSEKNILVVNTCAVTNEAEKQAKQYIRKISKQHPDLKIVATGCSVQTKPEEWSRIPEVHKIFGNTEKLKAETWKNLNNNQSVFTDIMKETETTLFCSRL